jgi:hypothetical protein
MKTLKTPWQYFFCALYLMPHKIFNVFIFKEFRMAVVRSVTRVLLISFLLSVSCSNANIRLLLTSSTKQGLEEGVKIPSVRWYDESTGLRELHERTFNFPQGVCDLPDGVAYFTILFSLKSGEILNFAFDAKNLSYNVQFQHRLASIGKEMNSNERKKMHEQWYCGASGQQKEYAVDISVISPMGIKGKTVCYAKCSLTPYDNREGVASMIKLG